jgi:hypothetical protein
MLDEDPRRFLVSILDNAALMMLKEIRPDAVVDATLLKLATHASGDAKSQLMKSLAPMPGAGPMGMPQAQGVPPGGPGAMGAGLGGPPPQGPPPGAPPMAGQVTTPPQG